MQWFRCCPTCNILWSTTWPYVRLAVNDSCGIRIICQLKLLTKDTFMLAVWIEGTLNHIVVLHAWTNCLWLDATYYIFRITFLYLTIDLKISTVCCISCVLAGVSLVYSCVYSVYMWVYYVCFLVYYYFFLMCIHVFIDLCASSTISTGWAKKVIPLVQCNICTRGITFLAHPV